MYIFDAARANAGIEERPIWQRLAAADATDVALREIIHLATFVVLYFSSSAASTFL